MRLIRTLSTVVLVALVSAAPRPAAAEVSRLLITSRVDVQGYPYERISGRLIFSVDPRDPRNAVIVDLDKAPRTADGHVEFSSDVTIFRPKNGGNGATLLDVVNRGRLTTLGFNKPGRGPTRELGDGFLFTRGFTIVAVGWEFDAPRTSTTLSIDAPVATENGVAITGVVRATAIPDRRAPTMTFSDLAGYAPLDEGAQDSRLAVVRQVTDAAGGRRIETTEVPRAEWRLVGNEVTLPSGFEPGLTYELSYRAADPRVAGVGFLAVRDTASWVKNGAGAPVHTSRVYAYGSSQSGRFLRDFVYHGCNTDERGRQVFDAMMIHVAGSSRIDLDRRWSTPTGLGSYNATSFPFADGTQRDPVTGLSDGERENPRASANRPKTFYTNTGVEYWGGARAAALLHVTADGTADIAPPPDVRIYFLTGGQHTPSPFPPAAATNTEQRQNPTDYWWTLRALLVSLDRWVREGVEPPASAYPKLADGSLVKAADVGFPSIPNVHSPHALWGGARAANRLVTGDGGAGTPLPFLVPQVDADGNERAGVRLPELSVPLATYTGWNFRNAATGGSDQLRPLMGSYIPFAPTRAERDRRHDPRASIEERYPSAAEYESRIRAAAADLARRGYVLDSDVAGIVDRALRHWVVATSAPPSSATAAQTR
jgi:hypothetical protein